MGVGGFMIGRHPQNHREAGEDLALGQGVRRTNKGTVLSDPGFELGRGSHEATVRGRAFPWDESRPQCSQS